MNEKIGLRILSALVLVAAIAGIGYFAFQAGVAQGSPITIEAPSGESVPAPYPYYGYRYGMPFHRPYGFGFGFGCFGPLLVLFLIFLAIKSFRVLFWGPRWGWGHRGGYGPWGRHWENGVPPMFDEWHKRSHGQQPDAQPEEQKES
ncbi:MAG TPA: hypothetical protein VFR47_01670 [Anaerolineales bacterium]|nr:hypothetical protein [Anaerolineales bacterium]